jgi:sterol desaturase/sphingolipid hydroxylase (fatty acid hydroxylase superfamily)
VMALAERLWPRRARVAPRAHRWATNLVLMACGAALTRLILPLAAIGAALWAADVRFGALNRVDWSWGLKMLVTVVCLDLVIYWQHRLFHRVPLLWRLHAVHHTDLDLDASSGVRFHPLEILLSMIVKMAAVALMGAPVLAVVIFEVMLNATSIFNHANLAVPVSVDAILRLLFVTPDMHRVHHTTHHDEQNTNFGFNMPWWDRLFGTYRAQPREGHVAVALGLREDRDPSALGAIALLVRPMRRQAAPQPS